MSSAEDEGQLPYRPDLDNPDASNKKRKVARACDGCRSRKIRCDGPQKRPGEQCSNCAASNRECTYVTEAKRRGPPKGYVEGLEHKLTKMEDLLHKLAPGINIEAELEELIAKSRAEAGINNATSRSGPRKPSPTTPSTAKPRKKGSPSHSSPNLASDLKGDKAVPSLTDNERTIAAEEYDTSEDDCTQIPDVTEALRDMTLDSSISRRFHGKSSGLMLIQAAKDLKQQYGGQDSSSFRREQFWAPTDWEWEHWQTHISSKNTQFPPEDLMPKLFDLFFRYIIPFFPVVHRPTFEAQFADGIHLRSPAFACVVLLVCAIGSKYSDDPRVCLEDAGPASAGWKYFIQVKELKRTLHAPATLADLQSFALVAYYLQATSAPHSAWTILGIGIRCAQDVGAHRRKVYRGDISLVDEQWKRVFWCLILLDRNVSSALGRPLACQDEDFDLDFPIEVDDDYWINEGAPKQPASVPSNLSYFNSALRLGQILAFALRTIYTINKSKVLLGFVGPQWEQHIVAELDSAMNQWVDSVPDHLRWDPVREHQIHFEQSAMLYSSYYHLHILIHRPFIPSPRKPSVLSFPSLAICTNAARSCSHVIDALSGRCEHVLPSVLVAAFTSGIVLLISIWGAKKTGVMLDPNSHLDDVGKCLRFLQKTEADWHSSGRMVDILRELASFGDLPLPESRPPTTSQKRDWDYETSSTNIGSFVPPSPVDVHRPHKPLPKGRAKAPLSDTQQTATNVSCPTPSEVPLCDSYQLPLPESLRDLGSFNPSTFQHLPEQTPSWYDPNLTSFGNLVPSTSESHANAGYSVDETNLPSFFPGVDSAFRNGPPNSDPLPAWNGTEQPQPYTSTNGFDTYTQPTVDTVVHRTSGPSPVSVNSHGGLPINIGTQSNFSGLETQAHVTDSLGIWQGVPRGFEWQDWTDYLTSMNPIHPQPTQDALSH